MSSEKSGGERLSALSALRFFAALLVVLAHFRYTFWPADIFGPFDDFCPIVSFFFMLSGFMLAHAYPYLQPRQGKHFIWARIRRIWPFHAVMLGVTCLLLPTIANQTFALPDAGWILAANLFLLQSWIPVQTYFFSFNIVTWYLSTLMACYLAFPWLIHRFRETWRFKLGLSLALLLTMLWLSTGFGLFLPINGISAQGLLYTFPLSRLFEFVVGMCGALLAVRLRAVYRPGWRLGTLVEILALVLVIGAMGSLSLAGALLKPLPVFGNVLAYYASFAGVTLLPFFLFILVFAMERGYVTRALAHPILVFLGKISFGIYMLHVTLIHFYLYPVALKPHIPQPTPEKIALFFLLLFILSTVAHRLFEQPLPLGHLFSRLRSLLNIIKRQPETDETV